MDGVTYQNAGRSRFPSPSIWGDCPIKELIRDGTGPFFHQDFLGLAGDDGGIPPFSLAGTNADAAALTSAVTGGTLMGGHVDLHTSGAANDEAYFISREIGRISLYSKNKLWLEGYFAPHQMADSHCFLFGIGETALLDLADPITNAGALGDESFIGFLTEAADEDLTAFVYHLDDGDVQDIVADATEASALGDDAAALAADAYHKYGLRFDGEDKLYGYVDGVQISETTLVAGTHPIGSSYEYGVIIGCKEVSEGEASNLYIDWIRGAYHALTPDA